MMGILSTESCRFFHFGSGGGWYDDIDFLSQCIADLNLGILCYATSFASVAPGRV